MTEEMDFELIIGNLGPWDTPVKTGAYYPGLCVIAVDDWTGQEEEDYMADVLSHEFIHHLLHTKFSDEAGYALDHIREVPEEEIRLIKEKGIRRAWGYMSKVGRFSLCCSTLLGNEAMTGNGVI
jgi:hypothetical protein